LIRSSDNFASRQSASAHHECSGYSLSLMLFKHAEVFGVDFPRLTVELEDCESGELAVLDRVKVKVRAFRAERELDDVSLCKHLRDGGVSGQWAPIGDMTAQSLLLNTAS
jgi:hypothetical protein